LTKETNQKDLQKNPTDDHVKSVVSKRDLQKRPVKEICKNGLQKRPTKETYKRNLQKKQTKRQAKTYLCAAAAVCATTSHSNELDEGWQRAASVSPAKEFLKNQL